MPMFLRGAFLTFLTVSLITPVQAQLAKYQFSGTRIEGSEDYGTSIAGELTLDLGATPTDISLFPQFCGEQGNWNDQGFSIDAMTESGFLFEGIPAADVDYETRFIVSDLPCFEPPNFNRTYLTRFYYGPDSRWGITVYSNDTSAPGDGVAEIPTTWDATSDPDAFVFMWFAIDSIGLYETVRFSLDSFEAVLSTIQIDGCDTGVEDFEYDGLLVSEWLSQYADEAKSHGQYVSRVSRLTKKLVKAGLLTDDQRELIKACASESSIGIRNK